MADIRGDSAVSNLRFYRMPLAILCGVLMALGMAPFDLWFLSFPGLIATFWLFLNGPRGIHAVGTGWAVGLGYFGLSLGWIIEPFMVDAAQTAWMAPFALFGMAAGLSLFWGLAFWCAGFAARFLPLALVVAWTGAELARGYVLTGFPWALLGYVWAPVDVIQWVSVFGPYGLTLVSMAAAACFATSLQDGRFSWREAVAGAAVMAVLFVGGNALVPAVQDLEGRPVVRLIQPNAAQHEKWDPDMIPIFFQRQLGFTGAAPTGALPAPSLIVWPETSLPMLLHNAGDALRAVHSAAPQAQIVVGVQRSEEGRYYNSLAVVDDDGGLGDVYDKHHLVPFGEYMPAASLFRRWNIAGLAARAESGYSAGPGPDLVSLGALGTALPLICYEAVFPQDVHKSPARPDMLLQITNDAWFGEWSGPQQHLTQARLRAIEQGLPLLRAANTGVSAVIDGAGRISAALDLGSAGYVDAPLPPPMRVTLYSKTGDFPVFVLLIVFSIGLLFAARRVSS